MKVHQPPRSIYDQVHMTGVLPKRYLFRGWKLIWTGSGGLVQVFGDERNGFPTRLSAMRRVDSTIRAAYCGTRKSGDEYGPKAFRAAISPEQITETCEAGLPDACPECHSTRLKKTHVAQQYQVEIPVKPIYRQFNIEVGCCACCGVRVQGRHELQTNDALGAAASQIGPRAQALSVLLNKELGLSYGKIQKLFQRCFRDAFSSAARFPRTLIRLFQAALGTRDLHCEGQLSQRSVDRRCDNYLRTLMRLISGGKRNRQNERLAKHLWKHRDQIFTFLMEDSIDATNWRAEQAIRPAVVNRKVWGGNWTWTGAEAQCTLMCAIVTWQQQSRNPFAALVQSLTRSSTLCTR